MVKLSFLFLFLIQSILIPLNLVSDAASLSIITHQDTKKEKKSPIDIEFNEENEENEKILLLPFEPCEAVLYQKVNELFGVISIRLDDSISPIILLNNSRIIWYQVFRI